MKKFLLLGLFITAIPAIAQVTQWDYTDDQITFKDDTAYTKDGALVTGLVKGNMYDYYNIAQFTDGKPTGTVNFYANNGTFIGSATIPTEGNTLIASDPNNENYKKMMASYKEDEFSKNQMIRYVRSCYSNFKDMISLEGGESAKSMDCQDIVPTYLRNGIGKAEAYRARRKGDKIIVETPFIAQKYRPAILMQNGEDGMHVEILRTGNAVFTFDDEK